MEKLTMGWIEYEIRAKRLMIEKKAQEIEDKKKKIDRLFQEIRELEKQLKNGRKK